MVGGTIVAAFAFGVLCPFHTGAWPFGMILGAM